MAKKRGRSTGAAVEPAVKKSKEAGVEATKVKPAAGEKSISKNELVKQTTAPSAATGKKKKKKNGKNNAAAPAAAATSDEKQAKKSKGSEIDDLFATLKSTKQQKNLEEQKQKQEEEEAARRENAEKERLQQQIKKLEAQNTNSSAVGLNPDPRPVRYDEDGLPIYTEASLQIGKGGNTKDCPFDCWCCF